VIYATHPKHPSAEDNGAYRTFRDLDLTVEQTRRTLESVKDQFTSIVVTGISGLVVGAPVALALDLPLVVVRKAPSRDDVCAGGAILGVEDLGKAPLFLDDLISSGQTYWRCFDQVGGFAGDYLYEGDKLHVGPRDDDRYKPELDEEDLPW
jgi:hypothetical protein